MFFISHRGNIDGKVLLEENKPAYINHALKLGFDIEIDVWFFQDNFFLGHDKPQYEVHKDFLTNKKIWCHAKNIDAIIEFQKHKIHYFWHQKDDITLTSLNYIWTYPGVLLNQKSICVMPEITNYTDTQIYNCSGICSDNIQLYKNKFNAFKNNLNTI